jgi:segregation and condensation protein B
MTDNLKSVVEALIFISVEPLTIDRIKEALPDDAEAEIEEALGQLIDDYANGPQAIRITPSVGGYVFATKPEYDAPVRALLQIERRKKLSGQALETLSAIAYHQPVTQAEIAAIRGVDSSHALHTLLENKLIKIAGRKEAAGRPLLYRTTDKFLAYFGLGSIEDLPSAEELKKLMEEGNG